MPISRAAPDDLPPHIEESVHSITQLHADHREQATPGQWAVERVTSLIGRTGSVAALSVFGAGWICVNLFAPWFGLAPFDPPPFSGLACLTSIVALYVVILILASEQRADQLAERREQLTLELAILSERKTAKVIQLLEEFRRDDPGVRTRPDGEAADMARPANTSTVIAAMDASHAARQSGQD